MDEDKTNPDSTTFVMQETNLFRWATSELSQDAVICWLLSWADRGNATTNPAMHQAGLSFLNALLSLSEQAPVSNQTVTVRRQLESVDIVAEIGSDLVLVIEDKIESAEHGDQLDRYPKSIQARFPDRTVLPVLCKTGNQSNFVKARAAGFNVFRRQDFLRVLREIKSTGLENNILADFLSQLEFRENATQSYLHTPVGEWSRPAWQGFFLSLQEVIPEIEWGYVPNARGGFMGAWWHFDTWSDWQTYLQIEEKSLVMKMGCWESTHDSSVRAAKRDEWFERLSTIGAGSRVEILRPDRRGNGASMTAAYVGNDDSWLQRTKLGTLDLNATVAFLREAMMVLDQARAD